MKTVFSICLVSCFVTLFPPTGNGTGLTPVDDPVVKDQAQELVKRFIQFGMSERAISEDSIESMAVGWFAEHLTKRIGQPYWSVSNPFSVDSVYSIRENGKALLVTARTWPDSVPYIGRLTVDWFYFLTEHEGEWRIEALRRTQGLFEATQKIRYIVEAEEFPEMVKPDFAQEIGAILASNEQVREMFGETLLSLERVVRAVEPEDSILFLSRAGDHIQQVNKKYIDWGMATNELSQEVVDAVLADASDQERAELESLLNSAAVQRSKGELKVSEWEREYGVEPGKIETIALLMKRSNITFLNRDLPWQGSYLMTIAGEQGDAVGYLYLPNGGGPQITPEEYFWLEPLNEDWWFFRSSN